MKIRGKEIDFKISRLKDAGNMEIALKNMEKAETAAKKPDEKLSNVLQRMINVFRQFFLDATGVDILEGCEDLEEAKACYFEFLKEVRQQRESIVSFSASDIK